MIIIIIPNYNIISASSALTLLGMALEYILLQSAQVAESSLHVSLPATCEKERLILLYPHKSHIIVLCIVHITVPLQCAYMLLHAENDAV